MTRHRIDNHDACVPCFEGTVHPWHDNGTINMGDVERFVEDNGGPTIEGDGYKHPDEGLDEEELAWAIRLLEKDLAEVDDPDLYWNVPHSLKAASEWTLKYLRSL